jgi:7-cyano-7-deazaguanine synthase
MTKTEIFRTALRLGVPVWDTWSCYEGGVHPCGYCDSCIIRANAYRECGLPPEASKQFVLHAALQQEKAQ